MLGIERTTSTARRIAIGGALAAVLAAAGCGGDSDSAGEAAPTSAPAAATTTAAATPPPGSGLPDAGGDPQCTTLLQTASATMAEVGKYGSDLPKAAAAFTEGAAAVRKEAAAVGGKAGQAGMQVAAEMEAAGKAVANAKDDPMAYLDATKKLVAALPTLAAACGVEQEG